MAVALGQCKKLRAKPKREASLASNEASSRRRFSHQEEQPDGKIPAAEAEISWQETATGPESPWSVAERDAEASRGRKGTHQDKHLKLRDWSSRAAVVLAAEVCGTRGSLYGFAD